MGIIFTVSRFQKEYCLTIVVQQEFNENFISSFEIIFEKLLILVEIFRIRNYHYFYVFLFRLGFYPPNGRVDCINIHRHFLKVNGNQTLDMSKVKSKSHIIKMGCR